MNRFWKLKVLLLHMLVGGLCLAQEAAPVPPADMDEGLIPAADIISAAPEPRTPTRAEIQQARLAFTQFSDKIRIAEATLDNAALDRKRKMGRLQALIRATEDQLGVEAARVQQLQERFNQVNDQLASLSEVQVTRGQSQASERLKKLRQEMEVGITVAQNKLEALTSQKSTLMDRIEDLRTDHITSLIEASVRRQEELNVPKPTATERLLKEELEAKPDPSSSSIPVQDRSMLLVGGV